MTSFSVCRVWGLFFVVLSLFMVRGYAQGAAEAEKVNVQKPFFDLKQPDERIVIEGVLVAKRGTPEGAIVKGNIKVGYYVFNVVEHPGTGEVVEQDRFVVVREAEISGVAGNTRFSPVPRADFRVGLDAVPLWRAGEIYTVVGTPNGDAGYFVIGWPLRLPGSGEGGPNSQP